MIIPAINILKRRIRELEELEKYSSGPLWVIDNDAKAGKEMNINIYDDLAGQYELYIDGEFKHRDDVADAITMGANMVTISEKMDIKKMLDSLFITENIIFYYRGNREKMERFMSEGGRYIYSDSYVENTSINIFTRNEKCSECNIILDIGEYNGRRN
ncbi:MAG: hypothetical protein ACP5MU_00825 [Thermoplasmata archaeon]